MENNDLVIYANKLLEGVLLERVTQDEDGFIFIYENGAKVKVDSFVLEEE